MTLATRAAPASCSARTLSCEPLFAKTARSSCWLLPADRLGHTPSPVERLTRVHPAVSSSTMVADSARDLARADVPLGRAGQLNLSPPARSQRRESPADMAKKIRMVVRA